MSLPGRRRAWLLVAVLAAAGLAPAAAAAPAGAPGAGETVHQVVRGDALGALARRYGVTVAAIVVANGLRGEGAMLRVGQRLVMPAPGGPGAAAGSPRGRRPSVPTRGPRNLMLAVPEFAESAPAFAWPVEGPVTSKFGRRRGGWHRGIDIKAEPGTPVIAAAAGVVVASGVEHRYGRVVKIEHADGFVTVYAHNEANVVAVGDRVAAGDRIATVGRTGRATSHHLHFEIRRAEAVYNPLYLLPLPPRVAQFEESESEEEDE